MATTVASTTPASAPRQPAWAQPITPASRSAIRTGAQSAHTTPSAMPGRSVTRASASTGWCPACASLTTSTRAPCTWRTVRRLLRRQAEPAPARGRGSRATRAASSPLEKPQFSDANTPSLTPPSRVKKPWRRLSSAARLLASIIGFPAWWSVRRQRRCGEAWRRRRTRPGQRQHLEQLAHRAAVGQAEQRGAQLAALLRRRALEQAGDAQIDPHGAQERSLRHRPVDRGARLTRQPRRAPGNRHGSTDPPRPGVPSTGQGAWPRTACRVSPVTSAQAP